MLHLHSPGLSLKIRLMDISTPAQILIGAMLVGSIAAFALAAVLKRGNKKLFERVLEQRKLDGMDDLAARAS